MRRRHCCFFILRRHVSLFEYRFEVCVFWHWSLPDFVIICSYCKATEEYWQSLLKSDLLTWIWHYELQVWVDRSQNSFFHHVQNPDLNSLPRSDTLFIASRFNRSTEFNDFTTALQGWLPSYSKVPFSISHQPLGPSGHFTSYLFWRSLSADCFAVCCK